MNVHPPSLRFARGFTLIELLVAVIIFGVVLTAINTVFYSALRLRARTTGLLDQAQSVNLAFTSLRRDLQCALPPAGVLVTGFKIGVVGTGSGNTQAPGIEFFASTGVINEAEPWGDIQRIIYQLREPQTRTGTSGKDLVRSVTRNLLNSTTDESEVQWLAGNVDRLEFTAFNGTDWRETWDTTMADVGLPAAIRVRIQMTPSEGEDTRNRQPLEMIVPLLVQGPTNQTQSVGGLP